MATPLLPNNPNNYMIPSALSIWFSVIQDDGTLGTWRDLGNVFDVALALTDEYLDHESFRNGINAVDKSVIIKNTGQMKFTIDELVGCNLIYMLKPSTTPDASAVANVLDQKRIRLNGTTATVIDALAVGCDGLTDYLELGWDDLYTDVYVRSTDGSTTYTDGVDYTFTQVSGTGTGKTPATIARIGGGSIADGAEVVVAYQYEQEATSYEIQEGAVMEGALKINALNRIGPMFQYYFPFVSLKIEGDLAINPGEFLKQAMMAEILTSGSGSRGTLYLFDCYQKLAGGTC